MQCCIAELEAPLRAVANLFLSFDSVARRYVAHFSFTVAVASLMASFMMMMTGLSRANVGHRVTTEPD